MMNPISSPGDPIFFLHHAWLDKLWADWQAQDPSSRLKDIGGNNFLDLDNAPGSQSPGDPPGTGGFAPVNLTRPPDVP
jgi:tyrosinase